MDLRCRRILFQGDSITDAGRDRSSNLPNDAAAMGRGYAFLAMCRLLADSAGRALEIYNRGISGDKVTDLEARWQRDCIELEPDCVSILIGINDLWHKLDGNWAGTPSDYARDYERLLSRTREALPEVQLLIGEPFVLRAGVVDDRWYDELNERRAITQALAEKYGARWIAYQALFDRAVAGGTQPSYWAEDGVHPTPAGHFLMAQAWLAALGFQ